MAKREYFLKPPILIYYNVYPKNEERRLTTNSEMLKTAEMVSYEWHHSIDFHLHTYKLSTELVTTDSTSSGDYRCRSPQGKWPVIEVVLSHSPAFPSIYLPFCAYELKRCHLTAGWTYPWQDHYKSLTNQSPFIPIISNPMDLFSKYVILALYRTGARILSKRCNALSLTFYRRGNRRVMMVLVEAPLIKFLHQHTTLTSISTGYSP